MIKVMYKKDVGVETIRAIRVTYIYILQHRTIKMSKNVIDRGVINTIIVRFDTFDVHTLSRDTNHRKKTREQRSVISRTVAKVA